ncbi:Isoleucine--tRNA ligase, chloroplastic/mitochondrial [Datura stramonium]|uniref:Isoleucine--tRNA ligase, chloroplastic/mitochondrial n=1 Tax=Datura stramonium TaxID=4076 RepID=A0ABS8WEK3_DATST|nr:Isoleucine--tRNA ligase, chloroplastic/mitochondrial [Datura stramonium]
MAMQTSSYKLWSLKDLLVPQETTSVSLLKRSEGAKQDDGKYKDTVDLPKTAFGMRANSTVREPELQKIWDDNQVFKRVVERNNGGTFVLHDGPPYANGDLHMGHALNKSWTLY